MGATTTSAGSRLFILLIVLVASGCGDEILCDSSPLVVIQAPTSTITSDVDAVAPGVQTDVHVRSTLLPTDRIELKVLDGAGAEVSTHELPAGEAGEAVFAGVTMPGPHARLRAIGRSECGNAEDEVELDVAGGPGCSIEVVSPSAPVTMDADLTAPGAQVDVQLAVATACAGRMVTSTCGGSSPQGVVPADGRLTLRASLCDGAPCEVRSTCTFRVSTSEGVPSQATSVITFDNLGPATSVAVVTPSVPCGGQVAQADDIDPATAGVQIRARVTPANAADATMPMLELSNTSGVVATPAATDVQITVVPGLNVLTGVATDRLGNRGKSAPCTIAHTDIALTVAPPASNSVLGRLDGTVAGNTLTFPLCGTIDRSGLAVAVRIDDGPPQPATVTGTDWCLSLTLEEAPHTVSVFATKGLSYGRAQLPLEIDLTPPPLAPGFAQLTPNRQRVGATWMAPSDKGESVARYLAKVSTSPLTDAGFETQGSEIPMGTPKQPGFIETAELFPARLGTSYWVGVASYDFAGNRSPAAVVGPITPAFQQIGPLAGPNVAQGSLSMGATIVHGKFNNDAYDDVAVAAPTQDTGGVLGAGAVYVYFGGPGGIPAMPSVSILGTAAGERVGSGLAAVRRSTASSTSPYDLAVGAPGANGGAGRVYVFSGGPGFPTGTIMANSAALQLGVSTTAPGWFAGAALGTTLAGADVDGDGAGDLVAAATKGGGGIGGIVIVYGGTLTSSVVLSDTDPSGFGTAVVQYMPDPLAQPGRAFGAYLHTVGPTLGALDRDDDLVVGYDDDTTTTDRVFLLRGTAARPTMPGLTPRPFTPGRDVRIELTSPYQFTEFGSQAVSLDDLNSDGAPEVAISAYRQLNGGGQVLIIDGNNLGNASGIAKTTDPGVVVTRIDGSSGMRLGAILVARDAQMGDALPRDDIDGDGLGDLLVGAASPTGGAASLHVWFGGSIPLGVTTVASAGASIVGPQTWKLSAARPRGAAGQGRWVGDTNGDGLDDLSWASPYDSTTAFDGGFIVLFDGLP